MPFADMKRLKTLESRGLSWKKSAIEQLTIALPVGRLAVKPSLSLRQHCYKYCSARPIGGG
eukprot:4366253-Amphidinium_carterae.1